MAQSQPDTGSGQTSHITGGTQPAPPSAMASFGRRLRRWAIWTVILAILACALYVFLALRLSYSEGERAGLVQKFSRKGWVCKTWEGEMAMATLPGTVPEKFLFTVRDDDVAAAINASMGKQVSLRYQQHLPVPSCFGETSYFVIAARTVSP